jgi:hypothetical protein
LEFLRAREVRGNDATEHCVCVCVCNPSPGLRLSPFSLAGIGLLSCHSLCLSMLFSRHYTLGRIPCCCPGITWPSSFWHQKTCPIRRSAIAREHINLELSLLCSWRSLGLSWTAKCCHRAESRFRQGDDRPIDVHMQARRLVQLPPCRLDSLNSFANTASNHTAVRHHSRRVRKHPVLPTVAQILRYY